MAAPFTVSARVLCTDRGRASTMGNTIELENDDEMDIASAVMERPPTRQYDPPLSGGELWRLVSALSLHRRPLSGEAGLAALRETLRLFIPDGCQGASSQVDAITAWECEDTLAPLRPTRLRPMGGAARGHSFTMRLNPGAFASGSAFLFASVVESFLALFAGINSFTRLTAYAADDLLRQWPPRSGRQRL
jgi:type VI secretion system protein ImpG